VLRLDIQTRVSECRFLCFICSFETLCISKFFFCDEHPELKRRIGVLSKHDRHQNIVTIRVPNRELELEQGILVLHDQRLSSVCLTEVHALQTEQR
jgi:hypothetical protein